MASPFSPEQRSIVNEALVVYKDEIAKLMKKSEKLGRKEAQAFKQVFLEIEALRDQLSR